MTQKHFSTISAAAKERGLSEYRLRLWVKQGLIPGVRCGNRFMIDLDRFDAWLDQEAQKGATA